MTASRIGATVAGATALLAVLLSSAGCGTDRHPPQATMREIAVPSPVLGGERGARVVLPSAAASDPERRFPAIYLLHGHGDDHRGWTTRVPALVGLAERHDVIIVTPDGGRDSWYLDSPGDPRSRYETHIVNEVVGYVDSRYPTIRSPRARAVAGLSMGGFGALYLALRHPDVFGAAGSTSGAVDPVSLAGQYGLGRHVDPAAGGGNGLTGMSLLAQLDRLGDAEPPWLVIDCGYDDPFLEANEALHTALRRRGVPHEYHLRPGGHDWHYWSTSVAHQLLALAQFFDRSRRRSAPPGGPGRRCGGRRRRLFRGAGFRYNAADRCAPALGCGCAQGGRDRPRPQRG